MIEPFRGCLPLRLWQLAMGLVVALLACTSLARAGDALPEGGRRALLGEARTWGYQLQRPDPARLGKAPHDVLVIDYSRDGSDEAALTPADLEKIRRKPDGARRIVLAYMSIGEAENYRAYWRWYWGGSWYTNWLGWLFGPSWLGPDNPQWRGNYAVRYWDDGWQRIILGKAGYLDRIIAAGFDGVYLDKIDSAIEPIAKRRATAKDDMRTFVRRIAAHARSRVAGFLVLPQNGEELLDDAAYRSLIDGMGKEDLLFGEFKERRANPERVIERRIAMIKPLLDAGRKVLAVEYLDDADTIADARARLQGLGYVPHFADRDLARLRFGDLPEKRKRSGGKAPRRKDAEETE